MKSLRRSVIALGALLSTSCAVLFPVEAPTGTPPARPEPLGSVHEPAAAPTSWKERMAQPYVYVEQRGDYRELGHTMQLLLGQASLEGIAANGVPFALFYDDPGVTPIRDLRARACLPVSAPPATTRLAYDVLPRSLVAYTRVSGPHGLVPATYPRLLGFLEDVGWRPAGPIREVYLVEPLAASSFEELVTEVQIPCSAGG